MRLWRWPQQLIGQVILVLMGALALEFAASSLVFDTIDVRTARVDQANQLAERLVIADRVLSATPQAERAEAARELSTDRVAVQWGPTNPIVADRDGPIVERLRGEMLRWEPSLAGRDLRLVIDRGSAFSSPTRMTAALRMPDGSTGFVSSAANPSPLAVLISAAGSLAVLSLGVLAAGVLLLRNIGLPLRALAKAADSVGQGAPVYVREEGAGDIRRVAQAFNTMQTRINDLMSARTNALAAVGHDLRTPLSRLRLRSSIVADDETRIAMERDVDEMSGMLDSLLAYLSGAHESEAPRRTDLAATCMTLVDAAVDAGGQATYEGPDRLPISARPLALKRAIENLIQNAIVYGGRADLSLSLEDERLIIRVEDEGPGIPESEFETVRAAFHRLEGARASNSGGLGLGLSIVQSVVDMEGGDFILANRPEGGLRAELRLPHLA